MRQAFPGSDYYGAAVALGVAPGRRSRVPRAVDVQDGLGALFVPLWPLEAALLARSVSGWSDLHLLAEADGFGWRGAQGVISHALVVRLQIGH